MVEKLSVEKDVIFVMRKKKGRGGTSLNIKDTVKALRA